MSGPMHASDGVLARGSLRSGGWRNFPAPWLSFAAVGATAVLAWLVQALDAPAVLTLCVAFLILAPALIWPEVATAVTVFLLYVNFPAILTKQHGMPDIVAGAFILLLAVPLAHHLIIKRKRLRADTAVALMLGLLLVMLVSTFRAIDGAVAGEYVFKFLTEGLLLYTLFINVIRRRDTLKRVLWTVLAAGALLATLGLYQDATGSYSQEFGGLAYRNYVETPADDSGTSAGRRQTWDRAQGPVDEPNRFAQILIVLLPFGFFLYRRSSMRPIRWAAGGMGLLVLAGMAVTLSRGALVAVILMAFSLAAIRWIRPAHLAAALLILLVSIPAVSPHFIPRMLSIANVAHLLEDDPADQRLADGAIRGRMTSMLTAYTVFRDYPVLGVGPGQFRFYYLEYVDNPDIKFRDIRTTRRAHTLYFEMGAELGVLGLGTFVAIPLVLGHRLWAERRRWHGRDGELSDLATACCLSLLAYLTTAIFLHLSFQRYYWMLITICGATLYVLRVEARQAPESPVLSDPDSLVQL
jgi:putative inorganic carbon (hco3(-)) transporter